MKKRYDRELTAEELAAIPDEDIDFSDIPELTEDFWANATVHWPDQPKQQVTVRLDADLLDWFKSQGKGYQTRINAVLRTYYESQRASE
jgi:uncharacterized protein (DUF4415 family)